MIYTKFKNGIIFNEDCIGENGMCKIPDKSIDMILADLPYGTTACKWDSIIPFDPLWEQYKRIIKDNGAIVLTASQPFTSALVMSNIKMFKYEWIWEKDQGAGFVNAKNCPLKKHENMLVFSRGTIANCSNKKMIYFPQGLMRHDKKRTVDKKDGSFLGARHRQDNKSYVQEFKNYPNTIIYFQRERSLHPTQKPVALFEYLIKTYTNEGNLVLDNTAGSGTTGVACMNINRRFILYEWNDKGNEYYDIAVKRLQETESKKQEAQNEQK